MKRLSMLMCTERESERIWAKIRDATESQITIRKKLLKHFSHINDYKPECENFSLTTL